MARQSRSKQRGPGAGTRSGTGGGPSKGGSRSSAGTGGGSKSGGNKSGSGKKSGGTKSGGTKSGGGSSKGPSGGGTKKGGKHQSGPPSKTPAPTKKKYNKVQQRFKQREAEGKSGLTGGPKGESISSYRKRQKQQVQDAAKKRNQKFVQDRKDKAVDKKSAKLAAATGIPSGDKLLAGSFGISAAGREQAAANRMAAQQTMNLNSGLNIGSKKFKDGQKVASSLSGGSYGGYVETRNGAFVSPEQAERMLKNPGNFRMNDADTRYLRESMGLPRADAGTFGIDNAVASLNPAAQLGNLVFGGPVSASQFTSDTEGEGAAGTPESGGLSIAKKVVEAINPMARALTIAPQVTDFFTDNKFDLDRRGDDISLSDVKSLSQALGPKGTFDVATNALGLNRNLQINPSDVADNITSMSREDKNRFGDALNALQDSQTVQNVGVNKFNLPSNFQDQIGESVRGIVDRTKEGYADTRGRVDAVNQTLKELGTAPDLAFASKLLNRYENPTTRTDSFMSNVRGALQPNAQRAAGLSFAERGPIRGSAANLVLGGMGSDIFRDARDSEFADKLTISGNNLADASDVINFGANVYNRMQQPGTVAATQAENIQNIIRESGGTVTGPGIIKGVTGFGSGSSGSKTKPLPGSNQPAPTLVPQEILEFLEPTVPTTDTSEMSLPEFVDPTDAYNDALNEFLYNPNYFPEVQQYQKKPVKTFAQTFNRDYF